LALFLRDAPVLSDGSFSLYFYWACCAIFSLISFSIFRLEHQGARYFSVDDIFDIVKAVVVAELLAAIALFSFTRLDGIPRSTLFIHSLILAAALIALLSSLNVVPKVITDAVDKKELKRRAKEISESAWAADAVKAAVDAMQAAVTAAIVVSVTAGSAASNS